MGSKMKDGGFTLVELLVTLVLTAILLALAVPGYQNLIASAQRSSVVTEMSASLLYGRSEAVKRSAAVSLCPSSDGAACAAGAAPEWNAGWIVFVDRNGNKSMDAGDTLLRVHSFENPLYSLVGANGMEKGATFRPSGFTSDPGQLDYRDKDGVHTHSIELNAAGRIRVVKL